MTFTLDQIKELKAPLQPKNVKARKQAGQSLSYIEGWHAIEEANRIFGFDSWMRETVDLRQLGDIYQNQNSNNVINYSCKVRITVLTPEGTSIVREGCGFGSGIDKDVGKAHESAIKEAETDAMKRALMTFGNQFGLALYDKEQNGVAEPEKPAPKAAVSTEKKTLKQGVLESLKLVESQTSLEAWYAGNEPTIKRLSESDKEELRRTYESKLEQFKQTEAA